MTGIKKYIAIALIGLNAMVLLGQIYPEGAPPFARIVNIVFLVGSLVFLLFLVFRKGK
jgi:hypothetical membrane protein